jgi:hypothetical protein
MLGFAVALEMVVQLALQDIGQLTDLNRVGGRAVVAVAERAECCGSGTGSCSRVPSGPWSRWLQPARALPVTLRPVGGETVNSYALRLSAANGLGSTAVLRSLGQMTETSGRQLLERDSWLNNQALARLEAFSAVSRQRLLRALPALSQGAPSSRPEPLPDDRPALHCYIPQPKPWLACRACTLSASPGTTPTALVRPLVSPLTCRRHQRWLGMLGSSRWTATSKLRPIRGHDGRGCRFLKCRHRSSSPSRDRMKRWMASLAWS